ncbi:MAG TPA: glycosyltransferase, partial [Candidatus Eisenbacteria bacterium]
SYFAREVLPLVRARVPGARFLIVGRDPVGEVRRLAQLPGVVVTGTVPDVRPYFADSALAVAPFRIARGVQNKVLEAMASGLPVVGTSLAFQALAATEEDGVRTADTPERLAEAVVALLLDSGSRREAGRRARLFVERHHQWEQLGGRLESFLASLAPSPRPAVR